VNATASHPPSPERTPAGDRWFLAGYAGLAGFFALEATVRQRGRAASLQASDDDAGTTRDIVRAFVLGAALPMLLRRLPLPRLPRWTAPLGLAMEATGLGIRIWSMRTLGASYSRTLRTGEAQHVVTTGPYRLVRHPGYLGTLLTWTGFGFTSRSLPVVPAVSLLFGRAYARRIAAEERLLTRDLAGYGSYRRRTKRLIPFVW
jgi:protein-S-isoprenylcysteine O-methyltransferase Ste14